MSKCPRMPHRNPCLFPSEVPHHKSQPKSITSANMELQMGVQVQVAAKSWCESQRSFCSLMLARSWSPQDRNPAYRSQTLIPVTRSRLPRDRSLTYRSQTLIPIKQLFRSRKMRVSLSLKVTGYKPKAYSIGHSGSPQWMRACVESRWERTAKTVPKIRIRRSF